MWVWGLRPQRVQGRAPGFFCLNHKRNKVITARGGRRRPGRGVRGRRWRCRNRRLAGAGCRLAPPRRSTEVIRFSSETFTVSCSQAVCSSWPASQVRRARARDAICIHAERNRTGSPRRLAAAPARPRIARGHDHDGVNAEALHREFECGAGAVIGGVRLVWRHQVGDVSHHEQCAGCCIEDCGRVKTAIAHAMTAARDVALCRQIFHHRTPFRPRRSPKPPVPATISSSDSFIAAPRKLRELPVGPIATEVRQQLMRGSC